MNEPQEVEVIEPARPTVASDPVAAGRLGGIARARNDHERLNRTRERLIADSMDAAKNLGNIVRGKAKPNTVQASTAILDRVGIGPSAHLDVDVKGSENLQAIILRLDAQEAEGTPELGDGT